MSGDDELISLLRRELHEAADSLAPRQTSVSWEAAIDGDGRRRLLGMVPALIVAVSIAVIALTSLHSAPQPLPQAPLSRALKAAERHMLGVLDAALGPETPGYSGPAPATAQAALAIAAHAAAVTPNGMPLTEGEAWYSTARELTSFQSFTDRGQRALPRFSQQIQEEEKWFGVRSDRSLGFSLGPATEEVGLGGWGTGIASAAPGFGDWDAWRRFTATGSPRQVLAYLRTGGGPGLDSGYLGYTHGNTELQDTDRSAFTLLAKAAQILGAEPVSPASRAALFRALATLPGLGYVTRARDPLGRPALAVTETTSTVRAFDVPGRQTYTLVMYFNPATGVVLGQMTRAGRPIRALQVRAGRVLFSWAYRMERIVNASVMPTVFDPQQRVIQRFSSRMRAILDSSVCQPFRAVHGGFNGGFERRPTGRCLTLLSAEHAKEQLAILRDPAVIAAWRHAITPPPAIPAK